MNSMASRVATRYLTAGLYEDALAWTDAQGTSWDFRFNKWKATSPEAKHYKMLASLYYKRIDTPSKLHAWASRITDVNTALVMHYAVGRVLRGAASRWEMDEAADLLNPQWVAQYKPFLLAVAHTVEARIWEIVGKSSREKPEAPEKPKYVPPEIPANLVPMTANAWELFSSMPGAERAARALGKSLTVVLQMVGRNLNPAYGDEKNAKLIKPILDRMSKILDTYGDFGAGDSEPRYHARHAIRVYIKRMGMDEFNAPKTYGAVDWAF